MQTRRLGRNGYVSALGLGCMGMSEFYGVRDEAESVATIHHALDLGCNFLDTSDIYGPFTNEELVGRAIAGRRSEVFLATKFGIVRDPEDKMVRAIDGKPDHVKQACDASLRRLGVEVIDLYYQHRVVAALDVPLSRDDLARIEEIAPRNAVAGERYPAAMMQLVNR